MQSWELDSSSKVRILPQCIEKWQKLYGEAKKGAERGGIYSSFSAGSLIGNGNESAVIE